MKKFKKIEPIKKIRGKRWAKWNEKLSRYDILIDLADIGHLSQRAYATGYLSPKTIKKWKSKSRRRFNSDYCKDPKKCLWLPATVTKDVGLNKYGTPKFWWRCLKCGCVTNFVWDNEISEPLLNAYRAFTRPLNEENFSVDEDVED